MGMAASFPVFSSDHLILFNPAENQCKVTWGYWSFSEHGVFASRSSSSIAHIVILRPLPAITVAYPTWHSPKKPPYSPPRLTWRSSTRIGLINGGTAGLIWMYLVAWIGFLAVNTSMAEMASMAPTSGGQYHWVSEFAPRKYQKFM